MSVAAPPQLTSLALANRVRLARYEIREELRTSPNRAEAKRRIAAVLEEPPMEIENMAIFDLLSAGYQVGRREAVRILIGLRIGEHRPVGELTERQRCELAARLRGGL